ncbi:uncharacterized protein KQ657_003324 [Scheffersomyces spartinae]|uniref:Mitochondrial outer membrane protein OM14 C-terminal domain-containing protein n=1 Tax=Scheffersomyces spartinae TaxID=45513 RepID=A0A9P8AK62_9ASCO|nr:uncharacterized protein KQ657_003324 [Scheffersomyces spartinae]KAG7195557.1 hypothetical protein KQ657_003324 [Scheffersomyces spartinae]
MSYAEAAASSGPAGAKKIPSPPQVETTIEPKGNVEVVPEEEFEKLKKDAKVKVNELKKDAKEKKEQLSKKAKEWEDEGASFLKKVWDQIVLTASQTKELVYSFTSNIVPQTQVAADRALVELQNPVVVVQGLLGITAAIAGYFGIKECHRIHSESKLVIGVHAAIITGLITADSFFFNKYYPVYDKKGTI